MAQSSAAATQVYLANPQGAAARRDQRIELFIVDLLLEHVAVERMMTTSAFAGPAARAEATRSGLATTTSRANADIRVAPCGSRFRGNGRSAPE